MKIGDWQETMLEEKNFWTGWVDRLIRDGFTSIDCEFQWKRDADIILTILECQNVCLTDNTRILEIGGGLIGTIRYFQVGQLFAADALGEFFIEQHKRLGKPWQKVRHDVNYISQKAEDLPLDSGPFDIVLIINSLDHCEDPMEVLRRLAKVTREGGWLFEATSVWSIDSWQNPEVLGRGHPHLFRGDELNQALKSVGFHLVEDPLCGKDVDELWTTEWTKASWPCYLRIWRRLRK